MIISKTALALAGAFSLSMLAVPAAQAAWVQADHVESFTNPIMGGYRYQFSVYNDSTDVGPPACGVECFDPIPIIVDWELPYFGDMGINNVISPFGWTYSIEMVGIPNAATGWDGVAGWATDPAWIGTPYETVSRVLHWYTGGDGCTIAPGEWLGPGHECGGFGFDALYGPTDAPYQSSWDILPVRVGDPDFPVNGVGSPCALGQCSTVPEPGSLGLLAIGAAAAVGLRRRKKSS